MASAAVQGFLTGFATTLSEDILTRKKEARDYFNKQVDYARTTGMENRRRVKETVNSNLSIARQLESYGIPKEVIMAQINQNPDGLSSFYEQAEKIRASKQRDLTPEEWKSIYSVYGQLAAPNEDLSTFITRTYDPISNATSSPDFDSDPEGSLIASLMGFNAMDKARAKLGETPIADGLTAEQLVNYGDEATARPAPTAGVKVNYGALGDDDPLSISESKTVNEAIDQTVISEVTAQGISPGGVAPIDLKERVVQKIMQDYPSLRDEADVRRRVDEAFASRKITFKQPPPNAPETATGAPPPSATPTPETSQPPPETAPMASAEPLSQGEILVAEQELGYSAIEDNGDGTVSVKLSDGTRRTYRTSDVKQLIQQILNSQ